MRFRLSASLKRPSLSNQQKGRTYGTGKVDAESYRARKAAFTYPAYAVTPTSNRCLRERVWLHRTHAHRARYISLEVMTYTDCDVPRAHCHLGVCPAG